MEKYRNAVEKHRQEILAAEEYLWKNPQTGYREWKADAYLVEQFEKAGYTLNRPGDIPGFTTVLDTGRPGPRVLVFGEMDSLLCNEHPECDRETGAVHACGHCAQSAALLGIALALKEEGITQDMCGSIMLCAVPAEELIELEYREGLRRKGVISCFGGKAEYLKRGYFDECDMAFMFHTDTMDKDVYVMRGGNGCILKQVEYAGKASHAALPHEGINALYAAQTGMSAVNAMRETFQEKDYIRYHPIITSGGTVVNAIPARVTLESYVRGASVNAMKQVNTRINRAIAASAAAFGAQVRIRDVPGYAPLHNDALLTEIALEAGETVFGEGRTERSDVWDTGCTDMGDISSVMPAVHPYVGGAQGIGHGANYRIADAEKACVRSAEVQLVMLHMLLSDGAKRAKEVLAAWKPLYPTYQAYFDAIEEICLDRDMVSYAEDGNVTLKTGKDTE